MVRKPVDAYGTCNSTDNHGVECYCRSSPILGNTTRYTVPSVSMNVQSLPFHGSLNAYELRAWIWGENRSLF